MNFSAWIQNKKLIFSSVILIIINTQVGEPRGSIALTPNTAIRHDPMPLPPFSDLKNSHPYDYRD
jgi:hypothetical protein